MSTTSGTASGATGGWWLPAIPVVAWLAALAIGSGVSAQWRAELPLLLAATGAAGVVVVLATVVDAALAPASPGPGPVPASAPVASEGLAPWAVDALTVSLPKAGSSDEENEDGYAVRPAGGVAAVADGASSSFDSGRWARHLAERYVAAPPYDDAAARAWVLAAAAEHRAAAPREDDPAWWGAVAGGRPSHATLLGVRVWAAAEGPRWSALAVGDAVVVHLRSEPGRGLRLLDGFPVERSGAFGGDPWLVASDVSEAAAVPALRTVTGVARPGDVLLLMTDELARWSLARDEAGTPVWELLVAADPAALRAVVAEERSAGAMVNDDLTAVRLRV